MYTAAVGIATLITKKTKQTQTIMHPNTSTLHNMVRVFVVCQHNTL